METRLSHVEKLTHPNTNRDKYQNGIVLFLDLCQVFFQEIEMKCQEIVDTAMMYEEDTWSLEKSQENPLGVVFWRRTWKGCVLW